MSLPQVMRGWSVLVAVAGLLPLSEGKPVAAGFCVLLALVCWVGAAVGELRERVERLERQS